MNRDEETVNTREVQIREDLITELSRLVEELSDLEPDEDTLSIIRRKILNQGEGLFADDREVKSLDRIAGEIVSLIRNRTRPARIAFLGPRGTFTDMALEHFFGQTVDREDCRTIQEVFRSVERGASDYGIVPVENSTEGSVTYTLDELMETGLVITGEAFVPVTYALLSQEKDMSNLQVLYSHPQTFGQCKNWIQANLPSARREPVESTARAAEQAAREKGAAALSSTLAGEIYGLNVLADRTEDIRQNTTRFLVLGRGRTSPTGRDRTSIVLAVKDRPGALMNLLRPFQDAGINMTRIESRPDKKTMWSYNFFIDFLGHAEEDTISRALTEMEKETHFLRILGSYPRGGGETGDV
jgi:chorismate mutase/prephenate dehydratase